MKPSIALLALVACASPANVTDDETTTYEDDGKADGIAIVKKRRSMTAVKCPAGETKSKVAFFDADSTLRVSKSAGDYVDLCYTGGDVEKIGNTIEGLRESVFSIYMGIQGERYRDFKKVYVGDEREWLEMQRDENGSDDQVDTWESYDTSSDTYLMMTDGGQQGDGTEFFAVQIPKCD